MMKKYLISLLFVLITAVSAIAIQVDFFNTLTGNVPGSLDHWDGDLLSDGDMASVYGGPTASYVCELDATSAATVDLTGDTPIVAPYNNAGDKRWLCLKIGSGGEGGSLADLDDLPGDTVDDDLIDAALLPQSDTDTDGYLSATDWDTFNEKYGADEVEAAVGAVLPTGWAKDGSGNMLIPDGNGFKPYTTTDGDSFSVWVYDVDGTSYVKCLTFTNGNSPSVTLESGCDFIGFTALQIDEIAAATTDYDLKLSGNGTGKAKVYSEIQIPVVEWTTDITEGDGKFYWHVGKENAGKNIVYVHAEVITAGIASASEILSIDIRNVTQSNADILSTNLTIDTTETGSDTAAAAAVIDTGQDDLQENDLIAIDVDDVFEATAPKGLIVTIGMELP